MSRSQSPRRHVARLGLLVISLLMVAAPAIAGIIPPPPNDSSSGRVGLYSLLDSEDLPGGTCTYGKTIGGTYYNYLHRVRVRAPEVFARSSRASQKVAWRLVVQAWDGASWVTYARSGWTAGIAHPTQAAELPSTSLRIASYRDGGAFNAWRGRAQVRWYARDGLSVVGTASMWPDHYRGREGASRFPISERCGWTTG